MNDFFVKPTQYEYVIVYDQIEIIIEIIWVTSYKS